MGFREDGWGWFASEDGEDYEIGPFETREAAIAEAVSAGLGAGDAGACQFFVTEARQDPVRLASWIDVDLVIDGAEERAFDCGVVGEGGEGALSRCTNAQKADLEARLKAACDAWQVTHGLVFRPDVFSASRNEQRILVPPPLATIDAAALRQMTGRIHR